MKFTVLASCALAAAATSPPNKAMLFDGFIEKFNINYATEFEKGQRFQIFSENVDVIYASNAKNRSFTLGITKNADQTFEEWRSSHLNGLNPPLTATQNRPVFSAPKDFAEPESVDWTTKGGVTSVKDQGTCGSCWTFSTVGALEGAMVVAGRKLQDLSMQHILACDTGGYGCKGGILDQAFGWVAENGVPALADEPYLCKNASASECTAMVCGGCTAETGESRPTCAFEGCSHVPDTTCVKHETGQNHRCECPAGKCFKAGDATNPYGTCEEAGKGPDLVIAVGDVTTHTDVAGTEGALEAAVAQQPVSVAIEADQPVFMHYTSGILTSDACGENLDHGVLAVGYGVDKGQKYWKVKNSWGTTFGEDGYIRIQKGDVAAGGECGIRKRAVFPTIKKSDTTVVV